VPGAITLLFPLLIRLIGLGWRTGSRVQSGFFAKVHCT
jgi:hypothetical protein